MTTKQNTIGKDYIKNVELFETFLRDLLTYAFREIRDKQTFKAYLLNDETEPGNDLSDALDWIHNFWWDNTHELIDMMIDGRMEWEDKLADNLPESYANKMHRAGIDLYGTFADQVFRYSEEKLQDDSPAAVFMLLRELEEKYGKSDIPRAKATDS